MPSRSLRATGALLIASFVGWGVIGVLAVHASLPFNPIRVSSEGETVLRVVAPELWRFFTRNPQEEQAFPFVRSGDGWRSASLYPKAQASNLFGLDRSSEAQGFEMDGLLGKLPAEAWSACDGDPTVCLTRAPVAMRAVSTSKSPTLCGDVGFVSQKPLPWAWASVSSAPAMPLRVVRLAVQC